MRLRSFWRTRFDGRERMLFLLAAAGALAIVRRARSGREAQGEAADGNEAQTSHQAVATRSGQALGVLGRVDDRYQRIIVARFDPLLGRTRQEHLAYLNRNNDPIVISEDERQLNRYIGAAAVCLGSALGGLVFPPLIVLTVGTAIYSTMRIFKNGFRALFYEHRLRMDVMGSLYFVGTFAGGFFLAGSFGLIAYYMSEKLVLITQDRSQKNLIHVFGQQQRTVWQVIGSVEVEVPIESVGAGDIVVIQAGQVVPVDGVITSGFATVDQHMLTGESQPLDKGVGDRVLTSTLMLAGKVAVRVDKMGEETVAAQIGVMLNKTASYQASIVSRGEQVADKSVPPTMALALVALPVAGYPYMVTILGSAIGLNIKLTAPIAMLNFLNVGANHGILVKDGRSLELLRDVDMVVFDKTGTLTLDEPYIAEIYSFDGRHVDEVLMYAAVAEHRQVHPIARSILNEACKRGISVPRASATQYDIGYGLRIQLDDELVRVGSGRYMDLEGIGIANVARDLLADCQAEGHSLIMVAVNASLVGAIELAPTLRPEVHKVVRLLRDRGLEICIISGDQEEPTRDIAGALGIPRYFANVLPDEKASLVAGLQDEGRSVCFVGDGINDSISLKKANVSVSLRGASTAATDTAQIVLMGQGLEQLPFVFQLASEFDANMKAGFAVAVGQGIVVIGGALFGIVSIIPGTLIWVAGLLAGLGIAYVPRRSHPIPRDAVRALPAASDVGPDVVVVEV